MYYIYPKLSEKDCMLFRLGGAGLGNILFTYARAVIYVQKHENAEMIWPTWFSFKLGPILRHESDKRFYNLEGWSDEFVAYNVQAAQKIMWIHLDFANVQYINRILTEKYLSKADKIVCVSTECLKNFNTLFPNLSTKSVYLPNINSSEYIKEKSLETLDDDNLKHVKNCLKFKIISVCRLSIYHKGIDRMIWAAAAMKKSGLIFEWYVLGDGFERKKIEDIIRDNDVEDCFFLFGAKMNPYPFIKEADVFCLPSRYEGKPIVITETMMLRIQLLKQNSSE